MVEFREDGSKYGEGHMEPVPVAETLDKMIEAYFKKHKDDVANNDGTE